jgi:Glycosyltransferase family 87/WD40-like Beta Propeller Repeat
MQTGGPPSAGHRFLDSVIRTMTRKGVSVSLALLTIFFFMVTAFRAGWQREETDFPNYYTAAVLVQRGESLRNYYDWTWFQRQMNYAGIERQLGAYVPQTPLTMLPMVGLSKFPVQRAKRVWLLCSLVFLGATIWMLSRVTRFRMDQIWLLTFCGYFSLYTNFLLGQYYVFLLFLLTLVLYFQQQKNTRSSGVTAGIAFALKLYGGPFLLYFAAKRRWKSLAGMTGAIICAIGVAIALFGWPDILYYLKQILPRSLEGGSIDLYNPGTPTLSTMLRHMLMRDPALNPHPICNAPWLFFWLRTFVSLAIVLFSTLGIALRPTTDKRDFAWFMIAVILLSTSTASYTFILLLLPVVLLLDESAPWPGVALVASYVLLTFPLPLGWLFPKVWLLLAVFLAVGREYWRHLAPRVWVTAIAAIGIFSFVDATKHMRQYNAEPGRRFAQIAPRSASLFSSFPTITRYGLFYQSMGKGRYVLQWQHGDSIEEISSDGHAFLPSALTDGSVGFELVARGSSQMMRFDPVTRRIAPISVAPPAARSESAISPDGKWVAFTSDRSGPKHLWLRDVSTGREIFLAGGNCNSSWPAWELDSRSIVFASDCGRAFGLPRLYRAQVPVTGDVEKH